MISKQNGRSVLEIRWFSHAQTDLECIELYIAQNSPEQAVAVVLRIIEAVGILIDHPEIGRVGRVSGTRELVIPNLPYIVPYRKKGQYIEVLRVFHQSRKWFKN